MRQQGGEKDMEIVQCCTIFCKHKGDKGVGAARKSVGMAESRGTGYDKWVFHTPLSLPPHPHTW